MHRIASLPGDEPQEEITLIEQPSAPIIFLTSATTDISALDCALEVFENKKLIGHIRALQLDLLRTNAHIDHYISTT